MPDVEMPDGTIIQGVPEGTTQSELLRRYTAHQQAAEQTAGPQYSSVGPPQPTYPDALTAKLSTYGNAPGQALDPNQEMYRQVAQEEAQGNQDIPLLQRESFHAASIPVLGAASSLLVPGGGLGALGLQSLFAGGGGTLGELLRQQQTREPIDIPAAAKFGAGQAVGTAVGGGVVKGLGAIAKTIFSNPLTPEVSQAAGYAAENKAPFPLSFASPSPAQKATGPLTLGKLGNQQEATQVAQFLNSKVGTYTEKANVFDDTARSGQQFLRTVFEPGETAIKGTFTKYAEAVGADSPVPTTNTLAAAQQAADMLENRGQTTGGLYQRLRTILKRAPGTYTPREFDELYGSIVKQAFTSKAGAGGEGQLLLQGITKDLDEFGAGTGFSFAQDIAKSNAIRDQFRELRKIPQLERLATEFNAPGGARGTNDWMSSLFSDSNGKALSTLRDLNPNLYHDLADAWLARQINGFAKTTDQGIGRYLDGEGLRKWVEQNGDKIKLILGKPQADALDNFSLYAKYMAGASRTAASPLSPAEMLFRGGVSAGIAKLTAPGLVVPGEGAAFLLARGLSDPSSQLFRVFTQGFSPKTRAFMVKSGGLAGQTVAGQSTP